MVILNTTFHFDPSIEKQGVEWIKKAYMANALKRGASSPLLTRILSDHPDDTGNSFALHLHFPSLEAAQEWNNGVGASLRRLLFNRWGEKALTMQTCLEVLPADIEDKKADIEVIN